MADLTTLEAIEKRIAESGRPMTRAESSTLAPLRIKRRKDEEAMAEQSRPKTRAEAATRMKQATAPAEADRYKGLRDVAAKVGEAALDIATQGTYSAAKLAAPAVKSAVEFLGRESSQPVRNRAEAATYMKNRQMAPATSTPESPVPATAPATAPAPEPTKVSAPTIGRSEAAIAEMESAQNKSSTAFTDAPTIGRSEAAIAEMESAQNKSVKPPKAEAELDENRMNALFRKTMGTAFDPKSKMDAGKMQQLRDFVSNNPDALNKSDTKIALDYYRTLK
jgi:hypothetical protein